MRLTTTVHMMIRDVGRAGSAEDMLHVHGPLKIVIQDMIRYLVDNQLNRRFDICIGRDKEECETRLRLEAKSPAAQGHSIPLLDADLQAQLDSMFSEEALASMDTSWKEAE